MFMQVVIKRFPGCDLKVALKAVKGAQEEKKLEGETAQDIYDYMKIFIFVQLCFPPL